MTFRKGHLALACGAALVAALMAAVSLAAATQKKSVWDGVYTAAQAERGQKAYAQSCGGCHRDDLSGGDDEPPLRGPNFTGKWDGASVAELYDFVASNMPKTNPGSLPLDACIDIVAFVLKSNEMPSGQAELTTDIEKLAQIAFMAKRP
jgi:S-disulfanyl-L-cysteine oxidoreductase SoxD